MSFDLPLDALRHGAVQAGPVLEVPVDHGLAGPRLGRDVVEPDPCAVLPDRADGVVHELDPSLPAMLLPPGGPPVDASGAVAGVGSVARHAGEIIR